jgi:DNA-binding NtrC family response regulator
MIGSAPDDHGETRRRVLVVDSEWAICEFASAVLADVGVDVSCALTAAEARRIIADGALVGLVFIAVVLPDEPGETLAAFMAESGIPVVLMSGHPEGIARGRASGYAFLEKPFTVKTLLRLVMDILSPKT